MKMFFFKSVNCMLIYHFELFNAIAYQISHKSDVWIQFLHNCVPQMKIWWEVVSYCINYILRKPNYNNNQINFSCYSSVIHSCYWFRIVSEQVFIERIPVLFVVFQPYHYSKNQLHIKYFKSFLFGVDQILMPNIKCFNVSCKCSG